MPCLVVRIPPFSSGLSIECLNDSGVVSRSRRLSARYSESSDSLEADDEAGARSTSGGVSPSNEWAWWKSGRLANSIEAMMGVDVWEWGCWLVRGKGVEVVVVEEKA